MKLISVPHIINNGRWEFDWEAMEAAVTAETKLFLLSNPQNPLGRVFSQDEIEQLAGFCDRHDLILISDEIHCDLILDEENAPHVCAASLPEQLQNRIITLLAPSKTYNIAGLGYAFAIIRDDSLRRTFCAARGHTRMSGMDLQTRNFEITTRLRDAYAQAHVRLQEDQENGLGDLA